MPLSRWRRGGGVGALKFLKLREEEWRTIQPAKHTIRFDATPDDETAVIVSCRTISAVLE